MKTKSTSRSAYFHSRLLIAFALCSGSLLLALAGLGKSVTATASETVPSQKTSGTWAATGSMITNRWLFTATLLANGKVLVAGGSDGSNALSNAELYDPSTGTWIATGSMTDALLSRTATLLPDGRVLVAGGQNADATSGAEIYDPNAGTWAATGSMNTPRSGHVATLITGGPLAGMVLVTGGGIHNIGGDQNLKTAELYDPSSGVWSYTGSMNIARYWDHQSRAALPDGSVLVVGGVTCCPYLWFNEAESYNSVSQIWTPTSTKMTDANEATTLLPALFC